MHAIVDSLNWLTGEGALPVPQRRLQGRGDPARLPRRRPRQSRPLAGSHSAFESVSNTCCMSNTYSMFTTCCTFSTYCMFNTYCMFSTYCMFNTYCMFTTCCTFSTYCMFNTCTFSTYCMFNTSCMFNIYCMFNTYCMFSTCCTFSIYYMFNTYCMFNTCCTFSIYCMFNRLLKWKKQYLFLDWDAGEDKFLGRGAGRDGGAASTVGAGPVGCAAGDAGPRRQDPQPRAAPHPSGQTSS